VVVRGRRLPPPRRLADHGIARRPARHARLGAAVGHRRDGPGQLPVFSSEPGEKTYTPLWREEIVTWKAGVTPVLVDEDTKIDELKKQGMVTVKETGTILNCPIIKVGKA
jgi:hypothetical protein